MRLYSLNQILKFPDTLPHDQLKPKLQELQKSGHWMHMHIPEDVVKPDTYRIAFCHLVTQTEIQTIRGQKTKTLKIIKYRFENPEAETFIQELKNQILPV